MAQVLRFYCVWDDRQALYGDRRPYRLHYFLEDDTVEILELHENNDGRDPFPVFLRRGPLPKVPLLIPLILVSNRFTNLSLTPKLSTQGTVRPAPLPTPCIMPSWLGLPPGL